jgi:hypothetical protein
MPLDVRKRRDRGSYRSSRRAFAIQLAHRFAHDGVGQHTSLLELPDERGDDSPALARRRQVVVTRDFLRLTRGRTPPFGPEGRSPRVAGRNQATLLELAERRFMLHGPKYFDRDNFRESPVRGNASRCVSP